MKKQLLAIVVFAFIQSVSSGQMKLSWKHLSTTQHDLPLPGSSRQQTAALIADLDNNGINDFVLGFRQKPPALVAFRRYKKGWKRYVIEPAFLTVEAGGAAYDIDGDGDLDLVFGGDYQSNAVWWWENPFPNWKPDVPWKRHIIKQSDAHQHHDQIFGYFMPGKRLQLVFWNQGANALFLAKIPPNPGHYHKEWERIEIFAKAKAGPNTWYPEGLAKADIDGDGTADIIAGNYWLKYLGNGKFRAIHFASQGGRVAVGKFKPGKSYQIVISSGDGKGPLKWYDYKGDPLDSANWTGHSLLNRPLIHAHSLQVADINGDGHEDIFTAEMAKWTESRNTPDNPKAQAFIFFGDGKGHFHKTIFKTGYGFHEAKVTDLDGDDDMDILDKPYNWETPRIDIWLQQ